MLVAMLKSFISTIGLVFLSYTLQAQSNLVPNPGFEIHRDSSQIYCGRGLGGIDDGEAIYWFTPTHSSDLFSDCIYRPSLGTPQNMAGFQVPRTGTSYAGIGLIRSFFDTTSFREYLGTNLTERLAEEKIYVATANVSLADSFSFSIDGLQIWLTDTIKMYGSTPPNSNWFIRGAPQVRNEPGTYLEDTVNWMQICDTFTATGTEHYLLIGNFTDSINIPSRHIGGVDSIDGNPNFGSSYYYIDDVSLYRVPGGLESHTRRHQACGDSLPYTLHARAEYLRYRWSTGDTTRQIEVTAPGTYWVEQSIECASVVDTYHVAAEIPAPPPNLGPDRYHCQDDQVQPVLLDAGEQPNYRWSTGETTQQITVQDSGWYGVAVDYEYCATRQDSVFLRGCPPNYDFRLRMPNVFTPNGDGANDTFGPMEVYNLDFQSLRVYDRWGRLCFEGRTPGDHWDGRSQGQELPEGAYYYQVRFRRPVTGESDQQRGVVTLLR